MTITRPDANRLLPVAPFDMVVFGGTGDLAMRKLMPALLRRDIDGQIAPESRIIGIGRSPVEDSAYARRVEESCRREAGEAFTEKSWSAFAHHLHYVALDASNQTPTRTSGSSIYPAVQNMLLAARALGLGATLTTLYLHSYALLPIGYPMGRFGPVRRIALADVVYEDRWGQPCRDPY
jgi:hypothetical protein